MSGNIATLGIIIWCLSIFTSFIVWILFIRPYIKKNGRNTGSGANYGWTAIADASIADEICKKNGEYPWFLRLFWFSVFIEFGLPILAIIMSYKS